MSLYEWNQASTAGRCSNPRKATRNQRDWAIGIARKHYQISMNEKKRLAISSSISSKEQQEVEEQWLPKHPSKFQQLHQALVMEILSRLPFKTLFNCRRVSSTAPPSYFGPDEKEFSDCLRLGVMGDCLLLCVFMYDNRRFSMWVREDYGVQESWTKILVVENLYPRELDNDFYEPMVFLSNGEIILCYNNGAVVCYNQEKGSLRKTKITHARLFDTIGYSPCFVSLYECAKVEEVKRVQGAEKCERPSAEESYGCAGSRMSPDKSINLNSGHDLCTLEEALPRATNSSVPQDFSWRTGTACTLCGGDLGYIFRGKGFPTCQQCFDPGSK